MVLIDGNGAKSGKNIFNNNESAKNALLLVMLRNKAYYKTFIHKIPQIDENKKRASQRTRKEENQVKSSI